MKYRRSIPRLSAGALMAISLAGCVTVKTPDKPIEINLNVEIRQEVLVRLQQDAQQLIQQNPDAFPQTPKQ
ncbi:YnbE family lipoprotein [Sphingomonas daechungensis]|uniref:YnbE family lipoprotein n=2 Tax=Sphingomonas daechungensis TaxID=1176646 RepID=A0ABX6T5K7_9SPHN|nr:YnbE family lipoprotein [Sphingomonas daechungensis]